MDKRSLVDILFFAIFKKMLPSEYALHPYHGDLVGFSGERVHVRRYMWLKMTFGAEPRSKTIDIQFLVIGYPMPYHMIIEQPSLNTHRVVISIPHLTIKILVFETEVATVHAD